MRSFKIFGKWSVQAHKQANIHTHVRNEVTLVWGSLRLTPINRLASLCIILDSQHDFCAHHNSQLSHNSLHTLGDKRRHSYHRAVACFGGFTLGSFLSDCPANMPRLGGPALTWQSDGSVVLCPRIQAKYVEICSDSMQSIFAVTDSTAQLKTHRDSR